MASGMPPKYTPCSRVASSCGTSSAQNLSQPRMAALVQAES